MSRRLVTITLDNLSELPQTCRGCALWELDPVAAERADAAGDTAREKEAWLSDTLLEWGSCGQLLYVDNVVAGFAMYAPPAYVPRATSFATSPVATDAILLMTARVLPEFRGAGLGRVLIQATAREVVRRGFRAIEAFGSTGSTNLSPRLPDALGRTGCVLPAGYLRAVGFKTVRAHPQVSRLRLDIRSTATWRADVESALERIFKPGTLPAPVG